ncbi:hypothetical protein GCM10010505_66030 [Kitasatospora aburaviensis]
MALMRFRASYMMPKIPESGISGPHRGRTRRSRVEGGHATVHVPTIVPGGRRPETGAKSPGYESRSRPPANPLPESAPGMRISGPRARMMRLGQVACALHVRNVTRFAA